MMCGFGYPKKNETTNDSWAPISLINPTNSSEGRINLLDQPTLLPKGFGDQIERDLSSNTRYGDMVDKGTYAIYFVRKKESG